MGEIIIVVILLVLVIALFVVSYMKKKKFNTELGQMRNELKIGDKVMTDTGVVGEVVDSYVEEEYKYFVLKTGRGQNVGYFTVHANAIYYVYNKDNNLQEKKTVVKVALKEEKTEEVKEVETPAETKVSEVKEDADNKEKKTNVKTKSKSKKAN